MHVKSYGVRRTYVFLVFFMYMYESQQQRTVSLRIFILQFQTVSNNHFVVYLFERRVALPGGGCVAGGGDGS